MNMRSFHTLPVSSNSALRTFARRPAPCTAPRRATPLVTKATTEETSTDAEDSKPSIFKRLGRVFKEKSETSTDAEDSKPSIFKRLGRVFKEKAADDFQRFFKGTTKTRERLGRSFKETTKTCERLGLVEELLAMWSLEDFEDMLEELEEALITADFGPRTALKLSDKIRAAIKSGKVKNGEDIRAVLKPAVILIVGVNGAGKTTTIGKLAHMFGKEEAKVYLIPGDTFRAAANEQLIEWGRRSGAVMGKFTEGQPPMEVISQCLKSMKGNLSEPPIDIVICDAAGLKV
eukprot:gene15653-21760_t